MSAVSWFGLLANLYEIKWFIILVICLVLLLEGCNWFPNRRQWHQSASICTNRQKCHQTAAQAIDKPSSIGCQSGIIPSIGFVIVINRPETVGMIFFTSSQQLQNVFWVTPQSTPHFTYYPADVTPRITTPHFTNNREEDIRPNRQKADGHKADKKGRLDIRPTTTK